MHQLILASESPRRKILLYEAGYSFETFSVKVSENLEKNLSADDQIKQIAKKKAEASLAAYKPLKSDRFLVLSADTMVVLDGQMLGKPATEDEACLFLRQLSGRGHEVKTALCLVEAWLENGETQRGKMICDIATSQVFFRNLSDSEIMEYVASKEPMDKAGAYGIQGKGGLFVEKIIGPYDNIVGLPRDLLRSLLAKNLFVVPLSLANVVGSLENHDCLKVKPQLIAVSKLQPPEKIRELYKQGQRLFAENYVQEAVSKQEALADLPDIQWHFIGRLQKNKVKFVVGNFKLVHSVDSLELAEAINRQAQKLGLIQKILLQINLAEEESKGGFSLPDLKLNIPKLALYTNIEICGLMTMPPLVDNPNDNRKLFKGLRLLQEDLKVQLKNLSELSMGTSSDYPIAVEEGATLVRLGTTVFGDRQEKV